MRLDELQAQQDQQSDEESEKEESLLGVETDDVSCVLFSPIQPHVKQAGFHFPAKKPPLGQVRSTWRHTRSCAVVRP